MATEVVSEVTEGVNEGVTNFRYTYDEIVKFKDIPGEVGLMPYEIFNKKKKRVVVVQEVYVLKTSENGWKPRSKVVDEDDHIPKIRGLINKVNTANIERIIEQVKLLKYDDPKVIDIIFSRIINEPYLFKVYADFCSSLFDMHIFAELCLASFLTKKHKNLCQFIMHLYATGFIQDIMPIIAMLLGDTSETNIEILCELITFFVKEDRYKEVLWPFESAIAVLASLRDTCGARIRFKINPILDL